MKLQRYDVYPDLYDLEVKEDALGNWCNADNVSKLEESHQRLLDALNLVLENDMRNYKTANEFGGYVLDEEVRDFIQDAISKSEGTK